MLLMGNIKKIIIKIIINIANTITNNITSSLLLSTAINLFLAALSRPGLPMITVVGSLRRQERSNLKQIVKVHLILIPWAPRNIPGQTSIFGVHLREATKKRKG